MGPGQKIQLKRPTHRPQQIQALVRTASIFRHGFDGADVSSFVMQRAAAARGREV